MNPESAIIAPSSLLCITFFLLFSSATCFDITKILSTYPEFSTFNRYLTNLHMAEEINKRQAITVLVVANSILSNAPELTIDEFKMIMNLHVVLDYYDVPKLEKLSKKSALLTTLFQSSGKALGQQGFINVTDLSSGEVAFLSAVKGSTLNANLERLVVSQPYNISVLQISSLIIPEGISGLQGFSAVKLVAAPNKSSKAQSPSDDSSAPTAADGPAAGTLAPNASPAPKASGSTCVGLGLFGAVFMVFVSSLVAL